MWWVHVCLHPKLPRVLAYAWRPCRSMLIKISSDASCVFPCETLGLCWIQQPLKRKPQCCFSSSYRRRLREQIEGMCITNAAEARRTRTCMHAWLLDHSRLMFSSLLCESKGTKASLLARYSLEPKLDHSGLMMSIDLFGMLNQDYELWLNCLPCKIYFQIVCTLCASHRVFFLLNFANWCNLSWKKRPKKVRGIVG